MITIARRRSAWLLRLMGLVLGLGLAHLPHAALAHAVLLRSIPSASQTLAKAPDEVRLLFSEPIDLVFSSVHVTNSAGQTVDFGDTHLDPEDDHQLVVSLQPALPDGVYSVAWRSLSTIDVHPDAGQYAIFVGVPALAGGVSRPGPSATLETTLGRWWFYLGASLFGGVLAAWKLVVSPALRGAREEWAALYRRAYRLCVLGGGLLVVGTLFTALAQAAAAAGVPLLAGMGQPLSDLLLRGRFAAIWWPRLGLEAASLLLVASSGLEGLAAECALATLPAVLLTSSLTSHGAAVAGVALSTGIVVDWLHILGAASWVGGLICLVACLPVFWGQPELLPRLLRRFTRFALLASAVILFSGVFQAAFELRSWSGLLESAYGQLVLVKVALFGAMLLLAVFNTYQARVDASGDRLRRVRGSVWAELGVGVVVLGVAAVLAGTPPVAGGP